MSHTTILVAWKRSHCFLNWLCNCTLHILPPRTFVQYYLYGVFCLLTEALCFPWWQITWSALMHREEQKSYFFPIRFSVWHQGVLISATAIKAQATSWVKSMYTKRCPILPLFLKIDDHSTVRYHSKMQNVDIQKGSYGTLCVCSGCPSKVTTLFLSKHNPGMFLKQKLN